LLQSFQPRELQGLQGHRGLDDLCDVIAACDLYGLGVDPDLLLGTSLAIVFVEAGWFEAIGGKHAS